jgi:MarR family transcriptional regulator, transcriptional regulator for hemolysin
MSKRNTSTKKLGPQIAGCGPDPIGYDDLTKVHPALRPYLGYCLHKVASIFRAKINEDLYAEYKMQTQHFGVLSVISQSTDINQMKICEEMGIDKASMVKVTDQLEKLKLIERIGSKADRRVKNLHMTAKGTKLLQTIQAQRIEFEKEFLSALSEKEIAQLKELLLRVLDRQKASPS